MTQKCTVTSSTQSSRNSTEEAAQSIESTQQPHTDSASAATHITLMKSAEIQFNTG
jgi:hypothetical protein